MAYSMQQAKASMHCRELGPTTCRWSLRRLANKNVGSTKRFDNITRNIYSDPVVADASNTDVARQIMESWGKNQQSAQVASSTETLSYAEDGTPEFVKRYVAEGGVPLSDGANFVMKDNFIRHLDNDGHLTGIWREPDKKTGIQIDANPLTKNDLAMLDGILKDPDTIGYAGNGSRGGKKLRIEK